MIWMAVTADKYELPIIVEKTSILLAEKLGVSQNTVRTSEKNHRSGKHTGYRIVKLNVDEDEREDETMGMRIDTVRTQKCLYGIEHSMTMKELIEYSGYGIKTVKKIREDPEKYEVLLDHAKERELEEYVPSYAELFAIEWERVTGRIKKVAGWNK